MIELLVASLLVLSLTVLAARKGHRHLLRPGLVWGAAGGGALCGYMLESLPFTEFRPEPGPRTILGVVVGALAGRMAARGIAAWAQGVERDVAKGLPDDPGVRLVHPVIAGGLWIMAVPMLYGMIAARHESLETLARRRDPDTLVVRGAEPVRLAGRNGHGVLLIHGWLGSPADFGDLPADLAAAGFDVSAPLLPGHGLVPAALESTSQEAILAAVRAARADLASKCGRVSIVGMSYGGSLAVLESAASPPASLVLVNPLLGKLAKPSALPVSSDALLDLASKTFRLSFRPVGLTRCNDPEGRKRQVAYATFPLVPCVEARETSRRAAATKSLGAPTLLVLSDQDRTTPADAAESWFTGVTAPSKEVRRHPRSDHVLLLDFDAPAAREGIVRFLTTRR